MHRNHARSENCVGYTYNITGVRLGVHLQLHLHAYGKGHVLLQKTTLFLVIISASFAVFQFSRNRYVSGVGNRASNRVRKRVGYYV